MVFAVSVIAKPIPASLMRIRTNISQVRVASSTMSPALERRSMKWKSTSSSRLSRLLVNPVWSSTLGLLLVILPWAL